MSKLTEIRHRPNPAPLPPQRASGIDGDCARRSSLIAAPSDRACATIPNGPKRYISAKPLARFVPELTKKAFQKHGFSSAALVADWGLVVGRPLADQCTPERLKWPRAAGCQSDGTNAAP
ncbi:MAG: DUF721 domain-containing protein, partial [Alphaproteobacteria bacterium]|nr:DUF721 domain-containing protein [Alphaproteobacteria bacterium]